MIINRFDLVFSYWIFAWFIVYIFGFITYNPKIAFLVGTTVNLLELLAMIYYKNSYFSIIFYTFIFFTIKVLPLWFLQNTPNKIVDFYAFIVLFLIYLFWLYINNINIQKILPNIMSKIQQNKPIGPIMYYVNEYINLYQ
jgi:predicted neutral ceramidase superfamily lipid hydrolase